MNKFILKIIVFAMCCIFMTLSMTCRVLAVSLDDYDYDEIDDSISEYDVEFEDIASLVMCGKYSDALRMAGTAAVYGIFGGFVRQKEIFIKLFLLGIAGALFKNLAGTFFEAGMAKTGKYIIQIALMAVMTSGMMWAAGVAEELLESIVGFMEVLIPTYAIVITAGSGSAGAAAFYEMAMFLIMLVDKVILKVIIPGTSVYMVINMMNCLSKDSIFGKLAELIKEMLEWLNKALFGVVIGLNIIKGLISPMLDSLKGTAFTKLVGMIPGAGTAADAVAGIVIGTGALIKNSIGVAAMIVIVMLCAMPAVKLFVFSYGCKAAGALLEPVADKNYTECVSGMHEGISLLMVSSVNAGIMVLITIAMVCASTNSVFYAGT